MSLCYTWHELTDTLLKLMQHLLYETLDMSLCNSWLNVAFTLRKCNTELMQYFTWTEWTYVCLILSYLLLTWFNLMTWAYFTFDMSYSEPLDMRYCIPEMSLWTTWDELVNYLTWANVNMTLGYMKFNISKYNSWLELT